MRAVGIITEYNPLHDGHIYHINESRRLTDADLVVCVMSGDYVQRGEPAVIDKFSRAKMAVMSGVDLVVELPVDNCLSSAEGFADGAVDILNRLGVSSVCFGCEAADTASLEKIADFLNNEPGDFKLMLKSRINSGMSYAAARREIVAYMLGSGMAACLDEPNNILGIEYIKSIKKHKLNMNFTCIARSGAGYNDAAVNADEYPSSTAIRNLIKDTGVYNLPLPVVTKDILGESEHFPVVFNDYGKYFYYRLELLMDEVLYDKEAFVQKLTLVNDMSADLAARVYKVYTEMMAKDEVYTLDEFALYVKSKQYALARVKRCIMRFILGLDSWHLERKYVNSSATCDVNAIGLKKGVRILAINDNGRRYISTISDENTVLITKVADHKHRCYDEIHAHNVYRRVCADKFGSMPVSDYKYMPYFKNS